MFMLIYCIFHKQRLIKTQVQQMENEYRESLEDISDRLHQNAPGAARARADFSCMAAILYGSDKTFSRLDVG